jgi:D-glycero-D-manno-heptose 1,7-bisphosphate phosphatase
LIVYDLDGTLIESYLKTITCRLCRGGGHIAGYACEGCRGKGTNLIHVPEGYGRVAWLPGRLKTLRAIDHLHITQAIATNQTGVAWGYQTPEEVLAKLARVRNEANVPLPTEFSLHAIGGHHPFNNPHFAKRRKPSPVMLWRLAVSLGVALEDVLFVGDMETDRQAADAAHVAYQDVTTFFGR